MDALTLLGVGIVALGLLSGYLIIHLPKSYRIKFLLIPTVIWLCLLFAVKVPEVLGYPYDGYPTQEFRLVGFKVNGSSGTTMIEAWVIENGRSRLYRFPFSPEIAQELGEMAASGGNAHGKFHRGNKPGAVGGNSVELSVTETPLVPLPPKEK